MSSYTGRFGEHGHRNFFPFTIELIRILVIGVSIKCASRYDHIFNKLMNCSLPFKECPIVCPLVDIIILRTSRQIRSETQNKSGLGLKNRSFNYYRRDLLKWHTNLRFENTVYKIYFKSPKSRAIINVQLDEKTVVSMIYVTFYRY